MLGHAQDLLEKAGKLAALGSLDDNDADAADAEIEGEDAADDLADQLAGARIN